jgi:hypothetical protein
MKLVFPLLSLVFLAHTGKCGQSNDSLLTVLKSEILRKQIYDGKKNLRIKELRKKLADNSVNDLTVQYEICNKLYDEYKDYKFDSAYVYTRRLLHLAKLMHDHPREYEIRIKLGAIQRSLGMLKEAFECIDQIDVKQLPDSTRLDYYVLKSETLKDQALYNTDEFYSRSNQEESVKAMYEALRFTRKGSYEQYKRLAQGLIISGQKAKAEIYYRMLLRRSGLTLKQRAMVAFDLSGLVNGIEKINLVTMAAIYDVRSSNKQTLATFTLGSMLFKQGAIDDAEFLLKEALAKAQFFGNKVSERELTASLTQVSAQKMINEESYKNQVLKFLIIIAVLALFTIAVVSFIVYIRLKKVRVREAFIKDQNQYLDSINKRLLEDGLIKEEYIGYFFKIISGYISKLEKLKRNTEHKLKIKNYEELMQLAKEIDIKKEREDLFYTFDTIFLKLFPNFIQAFNALLKPEDQIWPKGGEILNINLRIFALMRLGIKDNQTVANILESTLSTVYTYKNRIKGKALFHGDDFDNKIMEIKFVDVNDGIPVYVNQN